MFNETNIFKYSVNKKFIFSVLDTKYWRAYFKKDRYYYAVEVGGPVTYRGLENSTKMNNKRNGNIDL